MYGTNSGDKNCGTSLRSWETYSTGTPQLWCLLRIHTTIVPPHQSSPAVVDTVTRGDFGHPELEPQTGTFREETTVESASGEVLFKARMIDPLLTQSVLQSEM